MSRLFLFKPSFNADIGYWDTSRVTNMRHMFNQASAFNRDIGGWDVGRVTDMGEMFRSATAFNRDLSSWNVAHLAFKPDDFDNTAMAWQADFRPHWRPYSLALTTQPVAGKKGAVLTTQPVLEIRDAAGHKVTTDSTTQITAALEGTGGTLDGTKVTTATAGIAPFTDLALTGALDTAYRLRFTASGLATTDMTSNQIAFTDGILSINLPRVQSVSVAQGNHGIGAKVLVTITEASAKAGLTLSSKQFNGRDLSDVTDKGDGTYTGLYTVQAGDDVADGGKVDTDLAFTDRAGNIGLALTRVTLEEASIDGHAPTVALDDLPAGAVSADAAKSFTVAGTTAGVEAGRQAVTLTMTDGASPAVSVTKTLG